MYETEYENYIISDGDGALGLELNLDFLLCSLPTDVRRVW